MTFIVINLSFLKKLLPIAKILIKYSVNMYKKVGLRVCNDTYFHAVYILDISYCNEMYTVALRFALWQFKRVRIKLCLAFLSPSDIYNIDSNWQVLY